MSSIVPRCLNSPSSANLHPWVNLSIGSLNQPSPLSRTDRANRTTCSIFPNRTVPGQSTIVTSLEPSLNNLLSSDMALPRPNEPPWSRPRQQNVDPLILSRPSDPPLTTIIDRDMAPVQPPSNAPRIQIGQRLERRGPCSCRRERHPSPRTHRRIFRHSLT